MSVTWKKNLEGRMPADLAREIDVWEQQIQLRREGKLDEKIFAETRLRRGVYGQRYDNGQRHDGITTRELKFPTPTVKGPETLWDAPGMLRIKIPYGGLSCEQVRVLAEVADEYSDSILHVTTRQDIQLHYIHIEDTPDLMRRLASVGITTREACGNSVRNVTACPIAGVCRTETFDVTPYAHELTQFLLGHPDCQDFGRKFKIAFSGCAHEGCGLVAMHDMGMIAETREIDGKTVRGFRTYVGGGLGAVPHQALLLDEFLPLEELFPTAQAIARVYARLGEKKNRNRARIKFLVAKLGIDEFKRLVAEERKILPHDPMWTDYLQRIDDHGDNPLKDAVQLNGVKRPDGFEEWAATNVYKQRQPGYAVVTVTLPLGDMSSWQARRFSEFAEKYCGDGIRLTVEQNIVLRWVSESDLVSLYEDLAGIGLNAPGAATIVDVTACPGTDTCKLGIASSRGLAGELRKRLAAKSFGPDGNIDEAVKNMRIKVSGCFNSCSQHHVADLGFYGNSRKVGGYGVPHFQVLVGGEWTDNGGSYGLAIGSVPSKRIPEVVEVLTGWYVEECETDESFKDFIDRVGKKAARGKIESLMKVPSHDEDASFYTDWSDAREFTIGDMGIGECAGEVVTLVDFELAGAEREAFEAQVALEERDFQQADQRAYNSMLQAARALIKTEWLDIPEDPTVIVDEFKKRFYDTKLFFDKYAGGKFANYLFDRHGNGTGPVTEDSARRLIEEAQLFIEASHACEARRAAGNGSSS